MTNINKSLTNAVKLKTIYKPDVSMTLDEHCTVKNSMANITLCIIVDQIV